MKSLGELAVGNREYRESEVRKRESEAGNWKDEGFALGFVSH